MIQPAVYTETSVYNSPSKQSAYLFQMTLSGLDSRTHLCSLDLFQVELDCTHPTDWSANTVKALYRSLACPSLT